MRRTNPRTTVHGLLLACVLIAGACSSKDSPGTDGSAGVGGGGGRGGTGGSGGTTGGTGAGERPGGRAGRPAAPAGARTARAASSRPATSTGAPQLCGEVRNCVTRCNTPACAQACVDQAPAAARTKYQAVTTCSKGGCAETDINCRCDRECLEPGACVPVVDECREGVEDDTFCDEQCH